MSLRVWLPLTGDLKNQGISDYTPTLVSDNTWATSGKIGNKSLTLIKLQTILPTSSCMTGAKEISYCYWVKVNTAWSANWLDGIRWIETNGSATATARQEFYTNCTLIGTWYKGGSISGKGFTPGEWTHLAATFNYNTGEVKFYINGTLRGSTSNLDTTYYCRGDFYIGDNGTNICENDVRIYDHCLSAAEVKEISQGLILHYKLDDEFINYKTNLARGATCGTQGSEASPTTWGGHKYYTVLKSASGEGLPFAQKSIMTVVYDTSIGTNGGASVGPPVSFKVKPATTYTYSRYIKASDDFVYVHANFLYRYEYQSTGGTRLIEGGVFTRANMESIGNGWYRCWGTFTTQAATAYLTLPFFTYPNKNVTYELGGLQLEETTLSPYIAGIDNCPNPNLVIGLTAGGRTTVSGTTVTTAGENADTYFYLNLSAPMIKNHTYKLSCEASGLANETYLNFPIAAQSNTTIPSLKMQNGYNETVFRANDTCVNAGVKVILDDNGGTRTTVITATNFRLVDITPIVQDSSGYNHNGYLVGEYSIVDSVRYDKCLKFNSTAATTNSEQGISFLSTNFGLTTPLQLTFTWWAKPESGYGGSTGHAALCTSAQTTYPSDYNTTAFHHRDSGFDIYPSDGSGVKRLSFTYTQNAWHHYALTYDGTTAKAYQDGVLKTSVEVGANKTLATFNKIFWGFSQAGGVWRKTVGTYSDIRVYCTALLDTDIKQLYNVSMKIDKQQNIHAFDVNEQLFNIMYKPNFAIGAQAWQDGLNRYTQSNCQVNLTNDGVYVYRPANLNQTDNGNTMYGGLKIVNSTVDNIHVYDSTIDNIFNLQKGHTYIWIFHIKGNTTNAPSFQINNNMGWGGGGLSPTPSNVTIKNISSNFNGETEVWYKFTINDDIVKTCTSAYSSFVANNQYLSYKHFGWNWSYATTGNGTNIYITNIRLYDITSIPTGKLTKSGIIKFSSIFEVNNTIHLTKNEDLILNQFIER